MLVVSWVMRRVRIWKNSKLAVGFRGCALRVIDHEAVLLDPKLFSSLVRSCRSVVLLKVETKAWTADKQQPVALLARTAC
jgi:hypothetical protein